MTHPRLALAVLLLAILTACRLSSLAPDPLPTPSLHGKDVTLLGETCRSSADGLAALTQGLKLPSHLSSGEKPYRQSGDFDPNRYFKVLPHLSLQSGYALDYVYQVDALGGQPYLYYRQTKRPPFQTVKALSQAYAAAPNGEYTYSKLTHSLNYLKRVRPDGTPESYFELVVLALLGDQFYLAGASREKDTRLLCDSGDVDRVAEDLEAFKLLLPAEVAARARRIDFQPAVRIDGNTVTVRLVTFTKRSGFTEDVYVLDRRHLDNPLEVRHNRLVPYN